MGLNLLRPTLVVLRQLTNDATLTNYPSYVDALVVSFQVRRVQKRHASNQTGSVLCHCQNHQRLTIMTAEVFSMHDDEKNSPGIHSDVQHVVAC